MSTPSKVAFTKALAAFVKATNSSMKYARQCAEMAIQHYQEHGDLSYAQELLDAMPRNYVRRVAFLKWLSAHSPVAMDGPKLVKDKSDGHETRWNIEAALATPFWDFAPDPEQISFVDTDVVTSLNSAIARFENEKRYSPKDKAASDKLAEAKAAVAKLGPAKAAAA